MSSLKDLTIEQLLSLEKEVANLSVRDQKTIDQNYDTKFATHTIRLLDECEQILTTGDIDLQRNNDQLKAIRRGEWSEQYLIDYAATKERQLEELYAKTKIPYGPDVDAVRNLLLQVIEQHYGSVSTAIVRRGKEGSLLDDLQKLVEKYT